MKQGWGIKKLGEVCNVLNGLWIGKKEPFINICVIRNTNFTKDCKLNLDNIAYIDAEAKQFASRKLLVGDIIVEKSGGSEKQPVGRVVLFDIAGGDYSFSNFTSALRVKDGVDVIPKYLHRCLYAHYLRGETYKLQSKTTGLHNLDMKGYLSLPIPVPPIAEQEKIVAELDCLSGIIEKKKQQLKELDNLAQSIFYEMFGDPVENDKGWEKKRLGDLADISSSKRIFANEYTEIGVPFYRGKEVTEKSKGNEISVELYISEDRYNEIKEAYGVPVVGDILVTAVGTIGDIWVVDSEKPFYFKDGNVLWMKIKNNSHPVYFKYLLSVLIDEYKGQMANGCAYSALTIVNLKEMPIPFVPLTLQQDFASKIEVIEKQKELIARSIKETETLFNSRMDYYFN